MILVVGGLASGKQAYIQSLGYAEPEISSAELNGCPVVVQAQELVRPDDADPAILAETLAAYQVVACREVGSGVIPLDPGERAWRERVGMLMSELARQATTVVRMTCGIPEALKGDLPHLRAIELTLMRHGSTVLSERRAYTGWCDVPLSSKGTAEAQAAGIHPDVKTVHVSTLQRSQETAKICFPEAGQVQHEGLREMGFGRFEGHTADELADSSDYRSWVDGNCAGTCPGGENQNGFIARTASTIRGIVRKAISDGETRVVVVAHGGTIMATMTAFAQAKRDYFDWQVGPCEGFRARARFFEGRLVIEGEQQFSSLDFLDTHQDGREASAHPASHAFFQNSACAYLPCHEGVEIEDFNCLYCYCPLYALGPRCGGNFTYNERGRKDCSGCNLPHQGEHGGKLVAAHYEELAALAREDSAQE